MVVVEEEVEEWIWALGVGWLIDLMMMMTEKKKLFKDCNDQGIIVQSYSKSRQQFMRGFDPRAFSLLYLLYSLYLISSSGRAFV